jgi:hypothetical protein
VDKAGKLLFLESKKKTGKTVGAATVMHVSVVIKMG